MPRQSRSALAVRACVSAIGTLGVLIARRSISPSAAPATSVTSATTEALPIMMLKREEVGGVSRSLGSSEVFVAAVTS